MPKKKFLKRGAIVYNRHGTKAKVLEVRGNDVRIHRGKKEIWGPHGYWDKAYVLTQKPKKRR